MYALLGSAIGFLDQRQVVAPSKNIVMRIIFVAGRELLAPLDAGAFAFVMATGIVSIGASQQGLPVLSNALLVVAGAAWVTLAIAVWLPARRARRGRRPGFEAFAFVAATAVLGARCALAGRGLAALVLWSVAIAAWLVLLARRPRAGVADGFWFLVVVATESLAVLAALLVPSWGMQLLPAAIGWWALGLCFYPLVAAAIMASLLRSPRFAPDLWITMGALAIATLAGAEVLLTGGAVHALAPFRSWLRDADIATWALASASIVPLIAAELRNRSAWRYRASRWSFVFPLGMYAVATHALGRAAGLTLLTSVGRAFFVIAAFTWALVLGGLLREASSRGSARGPEG